MNHSIMFLDPDNKTDLEPASFLARKTNFSLNCFAKKVFEKSN